MTEELESGLVDNERTTTRTYKDNDGKVVMQETIKKDSETGEIKEHTQAGPAVEAAKAEQAKYAAQAASAKVKQEEEVLDMESYYDAKNQEKKEAKKLAQLAQWKHDMSNDEQQAAREEDEEMAVVNAFINKRARVQK